ncbi:MAG TPA: hydrogenase maturation protease, partial [Candidatus Limnocylindria bacterium]|nr:hydrogenase maturation protease [Candidatus Limnocylindria bacterium]
MRGDDSVGAVVAAALPASVRALVELRHVGQLMPDDLHGLSAPVIVVDAVEGVEPGAMVDLPFDELIDVASSGLTPASSHALPIPLTLGVVERLGGRLPDGRFLGVGAVSYEVGAPMSAPVAAAVGRCSARLAEWIRVLAASAGADSCA